MRFQVLLSLWSVTSCLCIDKIPEVAKTKVSKPKRYYLSKLRLCHAPLKRLIQTRPHMSMSRYGNITSFARRVCVCVCLCVCACERERVTSQRRVCERGRHGHTTAACFVMRLCSPFGLELMVKLRTLLTVFPFILKAKACDYGKGRYISECLWCSANHNALCQLANQSRLCLSEGGAL